MRPREKYIKFPQNRIKADFGLVMPGIFWSTAVLCSF